MAKKISQMPPDELNKWLSENYSKKIPVAIETAEDLKNAGRLLGELTNTYSYVMSLFLSAKIDVRQKKKNKASKEEINDAIDRRDILDNFADIIKMQYQAISRMITVKQQIDNEMRMM